MEDSTKIIIISITIVSIIIILLLVINNLSLSKKAKGYQAKYPSSYICLDGDKVRSLSECLIDNFFYQHGIEHKYEDVILKSVNSKEKQYKYDWYLPKIDLYIEFFGYSGKKYQQNTEDKKVFYRKHHLKMLGLIPADLANIQESLPEKFGKEWEQISTVKHCPNCGESLDRRM